MSIVTTTNHSSCSGAHSDDKRLDSKCSCQNQKCEKKCYFFTPRTFIILNWLLLPKHQKTSFLLNNTVHSPFSNRTVYLKNLTFFFKISLSLCSYVGRTGALINYTWSQASLKVRTRESMQDLLMSHTVKSYFMGH